MSWQTHKTKECPVCHKTFPYVNVREVPATCGRKMCETNYRAHLNRMTPEGFSPSLERLGTWTSEKKK